MDCGSADGNGDCHQASHEYNPTDHHQKRAAAAAAAGLQVHHLHAGFLGEGVEASAVFCGDLHGSDATGRTLWVQLLSDRQCVAGFMSLHVSSLNQLLTRPVVGELAEASSRRGSRPAQKAVRPAITA
mgnify:FL=1